jgi:hypothetical protein
MKINPKSREEWEAIRRKEALLHHEGATILFGLLGLLANSTTHVRIGDKADDQEDS